MISLSALLNLTTCTEIKQEFQFELEWYNCLYANAQLAKEEAVDEGENSRSDVICNYSATNSSNTAALIDAK